MNTYTRTLIFGVCGFALLALGCDESRQSNARRVSTRTDLVGGPSALGELGDFILENSKVRIVIQDKGFSRGFGVYGGSLIDADRLRSTPGGDRSGGTGRDQFGELFPAALLQALVPDTVEILNDGSDGEEARVRVSGHGGDFLSLSKVLNRAALSSHVISSPLDLINAETLSGDPLVRYEVIYALRPDERFVRITVRMINESDEEVLIPSQAFRDLLDIAEDFLDEDFLDLSFLSPEAFQAPLGMVVLFGAGNQVFCPGVGYGLRASLEDAYGTNAKAVADKTGLELKFPALAGILTSGLVTTSTNGISYGLFSDPKSGTPNFVKNRLNDNGENAYEALYGTKVGDDTMLIPFVASSFTGVFYAQAPNILPPGEAIEYATNFIIGDGDAASVMDVVYDINGTATGMLTGVVSDAVTASPLPQASVVVSDSDGNPISQFFADGNGRLKGRLPPGRYVARVVRENLLSAPVPFNVTEGRGTHIVLTGPTPARVVVTVRDPAGQLLPAKVTVVGDTGEDGQATQLVDIKHGLEWRTTDFEERRAKGLNFNEYLAAYRGRYIETVAYTDDGRAVLDLPPGRDWQLVVSRGIEYSADQVTIRGEAGRTVQVATTLERVVDTSGYLSADFHLHASPSLDSSLSLPDRVRSVVGEGVEILVATDHNFVTDYWPTIEQLGLQQWATSMVGLELTTLESGHFNGFPLKRNVGAMTRGAFEWSLKTPDVLFKTLREMGSIDPAKTIIQVNHPRDQILGYFDQYSVSPITGEVPGPLDCGIANIAENAGDCLLGVNGPAFRDAEGNSTFSYDFDAIEVLNGSVAGQMMHLRMPESIDGLTIPEDTKKYLPEAGTVLCEGGEIAFPGVLDDWFNMLNLGRRYIGLGTSDSHTADDHPGVGRSFVYVGDDDPLKMTDERIADAVRTRRVLMTTGPFVEFTVNGKPMGADVTAKGGEVELQVDVQVAPWVKVNRGVIWGNGQVLKRFDIETKNGRFTWKETLKLARDTWLVARVTGDGSLFPIQRPVDVPPIQIAEALSSIAGAFGFGESELGDLAVERTGAVMPVAVTNPIWVDTNGDADGDGQAFEAPGPSQAVCPDPDLAPEAQFTLQVPDPTTQATNPLTKEEKVETKWIKSYGYPRLRGHLYDVRAVFDQFSRHSH